MMMSWKRIGRGSIAAGAVVFAACSGDAAEPMSPMEAVFTTTPRSQEVRVYKDGPAGTYSFEATATGGNLLFGSFTVDATGDPATAFRTIWNQLDPLAAASSVTVTENVPANMQVDSIVIVDVDSNGNLILPYTKFTGTNTATATGVDFKHGAYFAFFNSEKPDIPGGGEGCTPGYWKQSHHFGNWTGYSPDQLFSSVFEDAFPGMTLLDVVAQGGGGLKALGRHTVAALLNGSGAVDYSMTAQQVVDAFNAVYPDGDYNGQKDIFEAENELGCPLGRAD